MTARMIFSVDVDYFPGSEKSTYTLLDELKIRAIKGSFFITGRFAEDYPEVIRQIHQEGHEIGCHGYSHGLDWDENFYSRNLEYQIEKIALTTQILGKLIDMKVRLFRAPYLKANEITVKALESLGYECDSSVASFRFDFGMGVSNNPRTLISPTKPYHPSPNNIFQSGNSSILEIPVSNFIIPLHTSVLRILGCKFFYRIFRLAQTRFDPVVMVVHPWELMEVDELYMKDNLPERHRKNRGAKCLRLLKTFLDRIYKGVEYTNFKRIVMEDKNV